MYLRKNKVKTRTGFHRYLSIAHNIWVTSDRVPGHSRPVVLAHLGVEDEIEISTARKVVASLERSAPLPLDRDGNNHQEVQLLAQRIRAIEPFLRALVRCGDASSATLQPQVLDTMIRRRLRDKPVT